MLISHLSLMMKFGATVTDGSAENEKGKRSGMEPEASKELQHSLMKYYKKSQPHLVLQCNPSLVC